VGVAVFVGLGVLVGERVGVKVGAGVLVGARVNVAVGDSWVGVTVEGAADERQDTRKMAIANDAKLWSFM